MDKQFATLERELEQLRPTAVSEQLLARLENELGDEASVPAPRRSRYTSATSWTSWKWANWSVAAALIALLSVGTLLEPVASDSPTTRGLQIAAADPSEVYRPVRAARTLVRSQPEGIIELEDGSPVERVRDYYVDTIEWRDTAGNSQLRWEVPREAVRFVALASY